MKDPFQRLPAEICLIIFDLVPDFPSLRSLVQASAIAASVFENWPIEILGALTSKLPEELQQLIRTVAMILCRPFEFLQVTGDDLSIDLRHLLEIPTHGNPLPSYLTLPSINTLICLSCRIHQLTASFLDTHIERVNSLQPMHLDRPGYHFGRDPFKDYPEGRRYTLSKTGAPSWAEEYRVTRSLWRLQLYYTLVGPTVFPGFFNHSETSLSSLLRQKLLHTWNHLESWELDEIECVQDYLEEISISLVDHEYELPMRHSSLSSSSSALKDTAIAVSTVTNPPNGEIAHLWHQVPYSIRRPSDGYRFFHGYGLRIPMSPLKKSSWLHFRRLGFGIWDLKRMAELEMLQGPQEFRPPREGGHPPEIGIRLSMSNTCFTWRSIDVSREMWRCDDPSDR